jgi:hypothetical protein
MFPDAGRAGLTYSNRPRRERFHASQANSRLPENRMTKKYGLGLAELRQGPDRILCRTSTMGVYPCALPNFGNRARYFLFFCLR